MSKTPISLFHASIMQFIADNANMCALVHLSTLARGGIGIANAVPSLYSGTDLAKIIQIEEWLATLDINIDYASCLRHAQYFASTDVIHYVISHTDMIYNENRLIKPYTRTALDICRPPIHVLANCLKDMSEHQWMWEAHRHIPNKLDWLDYLLDNDVQKQHRQQIAMHITKTYNRKSHFAELTALLHKHNFTFSELFSNWDVVEAIAYKYFFSWMIVTKSQHCIHLIIISIPFK